LRVDILDEGVHSGDSGGVVPPFRIARQPDRIDDRAPACSAAAFAAVPRAPSQASRLPDPRRHALEALRELPQTSAAFSEPVTKDPVELILNRTWRPALASAPTPAPRSNPPATYSARSLLYSFPSAFPRLWMVNVQPRHCATLQSIRRTTRVSFVHDSAATGWNAVDGTVASKA
jgi:hypothetical protein